MRTGRQQRPTRFRLDSARLVLRPLTDDDFAAWSEVRRRNEDWLVPWEPLRAPYMPDPARERSAYVARCRARERESMNDADGRLAGEINLNNIVRGALQTATIGYWIDRRVAGHSYMSEAVVAVLRFAFERLDLHRVEICIVPRNTNSRRVVEKLDLRCEGTAERYLQIAGVWEDHLRFAMTVEEWRGRADELCAQWLAAT